MAETNGVGGVQPTNGNYQGPRQHAADARHAPGRDAHGHAAHESLHDAVQVADAWHAAFPLLRERVLAATRLALRTAAPVGPLPVEAALPESPIAAAHAIQQLQRRLAGARLAEPATAALLLASFRSGLADAEAILHDVGRCDASVSAWFAAVAAALPTA